ncbi:hypothetical protein [Dinghuibacter silviterrae]|uniref:Lipocalin-like protein n=1 Tax=Dinghuibacter silviterrae TaxID=1539049 RepID=A0A4R8DIU7_9BACT|nr:hypothetical protein [Dinghuibacter silviterrae]TDW97244.1 hypothetical protein EDB95_5091 [Dinghuibacter silviterrae]
MRHLSFCFLAILLCLSTHAQNFNGQWKGTFTSFDSSETDDYVLELQVSAGGQVTGYSYTYFFLRGYTIFTICTVTGTVDPATRTVTVSETHRIKGNTPPGWVDCLQTHILTYFNGGGEETLEGRWKPAPGYTSSCGFGFTTLSRKTLASLRPVPPGAGHAARPPVARPPVAHAPAKTSRPDSARVHRVPRRDTLASRKPAAPHPGVASRSKPPVKKAPPPTDTVALKMQSGGDRLAAAPPKVLAPVTPPPPQVRQRQDNLIQTIEITDPTIRIELYDDGIIDHDTVTVYFNGKAVVYKNMLTHQPIKVTLTALPDRDNELILFADNLGDIPPNTALMVVHAGEDQYDVRVTSDLQNNGVVRFRWKQATTKPK